MVQRPHFASDARQLPQPAAGLSANHALLVTARRALSGQLSVSSRLLRLIIDSLAEGVVVANLEGRFVLFNQAAERILSLGLLDVPLHEWSSAYGCFKPDMVSPFPAEDLPLARSLRGEAVDDCEIFIRRNGGRDGGWISVSSRPVADARGRTLGGVVTFRDISPLKRQLERQSLLSKIAEETADAVLVTDGAGNIEYVNTAFEEMTGFSRAEVVGRNPRLLKSGLQDAHFYDQMWERLRRGEVFRGTFTDRRKNGELYLSSQTVTPLRAPDGSISHLVSIARDVTEKQKAAAVENSLRLARQVQERLFPTAPPRVDGLDVWGVSRPAQATGGDYFDFLTLPGGSLGMVIGDVSGHGLDSAIVMAQTRALLRAAARDQSDPARILAAVNDLLVPDLSESRFVSMITVDLHPRTRAIRWANAGHVPGYVLDRSGRVKAELGSTGVVLGLFPDAAFTTAAGPSLEAGDLLVLFTDGVTEAEAPDGTMCGADWALDVVRSRAHLSSAEILEALCGEIEAFAAGSAQHDDVTAIVCRVGEGAPASVARRARTGRQPASTANGRARRRRP